MARVKGKIRGKYPVIGGSGARKQQNSPRRRTESPWSRVIATWSPWSESQNLLPQINPEDEDQTYLFLLSLRFSPCLRISVVNKDLRRTIAALQLVMV